MRRGLKLGLGLGSGLVDDGAPIAPSAFTAGQWTLGDSPSAGGDTLTITIIALPVNGNSPITALEYRLNGGSATALIGVGTGARDITVPATTLATVEIRAVNAIGNGAWSDLKSATPTVDAIADPPVLTLESYVGDDVELSIDIDGTGYWKWSASATPLSGAAIKAAPDGTEAWFGPGTVTETIADPGPGTWYLNLVAENVAGFSNVITIEEIVAGQTFTETWSSYSNGNTWTQLDTAYDRNSTQMIPTIVTDADGPAGLGLDLTIGTANDRYMARTDISTALALRTTERVQMLVKVEFTTLASARAILGSVDGSVLNTGILVYRNAANDWRIAIQEDGVWSSGTNRTEFVSGVSDTAIYWIRWEVDGLDLKGRAWADGGGEPGTWGATRTAGAALDVVNAALGNRTSGTAIRVLGYSIGIDANAPTF